MNILIYNEGFHDKKPEIKAVYPNGIHTRLKEILVSLGNVTVATLDNVEEVFTEDTVKNADVIFWWGHVKHGDVPDKIVERVVSAVLSGTGFIALHSAHLSKPFTRLMGTSCTLRWRDDDRERIWTVAPTHPIAEGIPECFELKNEEMYGEHFDIPTPDETVFIGWFAGGEVFRSGCTFKRGYGNIFYFQPGHEEYPTYFDENVVRIIKNAAKWACPLKRRENPFCIHAKISPEKESQC